MAYVVIRRSVVLPDVEWVLGIGDARVCDQEPERLISHVERVAPTIVNVESDVRGQLALEADVKAVIVSCSAREVLVYGSQRRVGSRGGQAGETAWANSRPAESV
jgi:hypothetical protein